MKKILTIGLVLSLGLVSCNDWLNLEPKSQLTPAQYLTTEDNVASYATDLYNTLRTHGETSWGTWTYDNATDNMVHADPSDLFAPGYWKVGQTGGDYEFAAIFRCNYFFEAVLPQFESGKLAGSNIKHYIGEVYFFRALQYFNKLKTLGDFPIVENVLVDELGNLVEASVRSPRNEVARFILSDLDKAIEHLGTKAPIGGTNRLYKACAHLLKSRVALYEGTWLKYFKGTAFVPNGEGWPGKAKNPNYEFPSGSIENEIDYFLGIAMDEAALIADSYALVQNTGLFQTSPAEAANPYFNMFGDTNLNDYSEVMLWRQYSVAMGIVNSVAEFAAASNQGYGITKSMVDAFVMSNALPIYASESGYPGDADLLTITQNRDSRAQIFIKKPGDTNTFTAPGPESFQVEPYPNVVHSTASMKYTTGYALRKGLNFNGEQTIRNKCEVGSIVFRATEAYLNYIEACYEKTGTIDTKAATYWKAIRDRSGVADYQITIDNTNMAIESQTDWGAWSAGTVVDPVLFNIRRERRCELMAEGFRSDDIRRWRSMDQMITTPYHPLGVNLFDSLIDNTDFITRNGNDLREGENISPKEFSKYLAPFHIVSNNRVYNGYTWKMAHYLSPIAVQHFLITGNGDASASTLYQNPYWPLTAGTGAEQ